MNNVFYKENEVILVNSGTLPYNGNTVVGYTDFWRGYRKGQQLDSENA